MKKKLFVKSLQDLQRQMEIDNKFSKAMRRFFPESFCLYYDNSLLFDAMIGLLKEYFDDEGNYIEYFIYDLNFGKRNRETAKNRLTVTDNCGENIQLENAEDLYNFLTETKK